MCSLAAFSIGCSSPDRGMLERDAVRRSIEQVASSVDPVSGRKGSPELDAALRDALRESARVDARLRWWRFTERTDLDAWARAAHLASTRARELHERRERLSEEWMQALDRADSLLDEVMAHPLQPPSASATVHAQKASVELGVARSLAEQLRMPDAIAAASRSIAESERALAERDRRLARFDDAANLRLWGLWVAETISQSARSRSTALVVDKLSRKLHVYENGKRSLTFDVELGAGALARKLHQGDRATPEGRYRVREVRGPGSTVYHRALLLDYPNEEDRRRFREAKARGEISSRAAIGGLIEIHGEGGRGSDWTEGCVALGNDEMDRLVRLVRVGTPVTIVGRIP